MRERFPRHRKLCWCWYISLSPNHEVPTSRNFNFTLPRVIEENLSTWEFLQTRQERERGVHCVLAQGELHTSGGWNLCQSQGQAGGHLCWAGVYLVFHSLHLLGMIFALGWKSLHLLWRSPGTVLAKKPSLQSSDLPCSALGLRGSVHLCAAQLSRLWERFQLHRDSGWYGNVLRAITAWKHMVIIH